MTIRPSSADNLYRRAIHVERGFIRVDADEVTYPLHVILRYRLEKAMLEGDLEVADLPGAWNEGMQELLGLTPPDDRLGLPAGHPLVGGRDRLFPLLHARRDHGGAAVRGGERRRARHRGRRSSAAISRRLLDWLRANVHEQGSLLDMPELLTRATGRPLELQPFLDHLRTRYLALRGDRLLLYAPGRLCYF